MESEKRRSTLSVLFYVKKQKLLKKGEVPICMRITVDRRKAEIIVNRKACQKTKQMCNIFVLSLAGNLMEKYTDNLECIKRSFLFPVISNQSYNEHIRSTFQIT